MSELVEIAAKAIFLSRFGPECNGDQRTETFWPDRLDELTVESADGYRAYARIAIEAVMAHFKDLAETCQFSEDRHAMFAAVEEIEEALQTAKT